MQIKGSFFTMETEEVRFFSFDTNLSTKSAIWMCWFYSRG